MKPLTFQSALYSSCVAHNFDVCVCRLWEDGWKERYYEHKFDVSREDEGYADFRKKVVRSTGVLPLFRPSIPPPPPCFYSVPPCPPCFCLLSSSQKSEKYEVAAWGQKQDLLLMLTCLTAPHFYDLVSPCFCPLPLSPCCYHVPPC